MDEKKMTDFRTLINRLDAILTEGKQDPCWKGYKQIGTKEKAGKTVPNCVPTTEDIANDDMEGEFTQNELTTIARMTDILLDHINDSDDLPEWVQSKISQATQMLVSVTDYLVSEHESELDEDWQKVNKKDKTDGMSKKAVAAYRRENPGSKLKTAVTKDPKKIKKGSKDAKRRSSYCSRSAGQMKMHDISCAKTPDKPICKARRRWNCE